MNRIKHVIGIILLLLIILVFCSCNQIKQGEVYDKQYNEAHTEVYTYTTVTLVGETPIIIPHTATRYCPDEYVVFIRQKSEDGYDTAKYSVSKERYDEIKIGEYISFE